MFGYWAIGYFERHQFLSKTALDTFGLLSVKIGLLLMPTSCHTDYKSTFFRQNLRHCDQMANLVVQYLVICNNENLSNRIKMTKVGSMFWQMPKKPSLDRQILLKSHQSGEISPNLVTLAKKLSAEGKRREKNGAAFVWVKAIRTLHSGVLTCSRWLTDVLILTGFNLQWKWWWWLATKSQHFFVAQI